MSEKLTGDALKKALEERGLPDEGSADEKRASVEAYDAEQAATTPGAGPAVVIPPEPETKGTTTLDSDVKTPSKTEPGDGPADTTDPTETAHSVTPTPGVEAIKVGTVNAVLPGPKVEVAAGVPESEQRVEEYPATKPDGTVVTVRHNLDTGETTVSA